MAVYKDNATGTWRVIYRFTNWKGERKQTQKRGFATKREAQAWEHEAIDGFAPNRPRPSCRIVGQVVKVYRMVEYRRQLCMNCPQIKEQPHNQNATVSL